MTRALLIKIPFLCYLIPFVYLSLWFDFRFHSPIPLVITLFIGMIAGFFFCYTKQIFAMVLGNAVSTFLSFYLASNMEDWKFFYQPFHPNFLIALFAGLLILPQAIGAFWAIFFLREKRRRPLSSK